MYGIMRVFVVLMLFHFTGLTSPVLTIQRIMTVYNFMMDIHSWSKGINPLLSLSLIKHNNSDTGIFL